MKPSHNWAWITGAMSEADLRDLAKHLDYLPGDLRRRLRFLSAVNDEIDVYRKLTKPLVERKEQSRSRLGVLSKAADDFDKAVRALDPADLEAIEIELAMQKRRGSPAGDAEAQLYEAIAEVNSISVAGEFSRKISAAAAGAAAKPSAPNGRRDGSGSPIDDADRSLIKRIGEIYAAVFGEQPSSAATGVFTRALFKIFAQAGIKTRPKQKRLAAIIDGSPVISKARAPKRGPKPRFIS